MLKVDKVHPLYGYDKYLPVHMLCELNLFHANNLIGIEHIQTCTHEQLRGFGHLTDTLIINEILRAVLEDGAGGNEALLLKWIVD